MTTHAPHAPLDLCVVCGGVYPPQTAPEPYVDVRALAAAMGWSVDSVYASVRAGLIPHTRLHTTRGGRGALRFRVSDVERAVLIPAA